MGQQCPLLDNRGKQISLVPGMSSFFQVVDQKGLKCSLITAIVGVLVYPPQLDG